MTLTPIPDPVLRTWRRWLADEELWPEPSVLVHGDVHPGHTLVDQTGALTGIIDWTDATIGCPATDFIDQRHAFGAEVADRLVRAYAAAGGSLPARFREQIIMRQSLRPLGALLFGLGGSAPETARPDLVRRSHERLADQAARIEAGRCPV